MGRSLAVLNLDLDNTKANNGDKIMGFQPLTLIAKLYKFKHQAYHSVIKEKENTGMLNEKMGMILGKENGVFYLGDSSTRVVT